MQTTRTTSPSTVWRDTLLRAARNQLDSDACVASVWWEARVAAVMRRRVTQACCFRERSSARLGLEKREQPRCRTVAVASGRGVPGRLAQRVARAARQHQEPAPSVQNRRKLLTISSGWVA